MGGRSALVSYLALSWLSLRFCPPSPEGGGSNYLEGTYGDFQSGIFGPPGLLSQRSLYDASIGVHPPEPDIRLSSYYFTPPYRRD
jgi:hypothetical protein